MNFRSYVIAFVLNFDIQKILFNLSRVKKFKKIVKKNFNNVLNIPTEKH